MLSTRASAPLTPLPPPCSARVQVSGFLSFDKEDTDEEKKAGIASIVSLGDQVWVKVSEHTAFLLALRSFAPLVAVTPTRTTPWMKCDAVRPLATAVHVYHAAAAAAGTAAGG